MNVAVLAGTFITAIIAFVLGTTLVLRGRVRIVHRSEWSIGLYGGPSPLTLKPLSHIVNPILTAAAVTDVPAHFVADPFLWKHDTTWYLFCEVYNTLLNRGQIGLAASKDGLHYTYERIVLSEPFHMSYPYLFEWEDTIYMLPESAAGNTVRLYRAVSFPYIWEIASELLHGAFCDSSLVRYHEKWWLFTCDESSQAAQRHKNLRLFFADTLQGPYTEHPQSPIVRNNPHKARPGGRMLVENGRLIRFAQDCRPTYGGSLNAFEIETLSETEYKERAIKGNPVLKAGRRGWNRHGMHHADPHQLEDGSWIASVDGYRKFLTMQYEY